MLTLSHRALTEEEGSLPLCSSGWDRGDPAVLPAVTSRELGKGPAQEDPVFPWTWVPELHTQCDIYKFTGTLASSFVKQKE